MDSKEYNSVLVSDLKDQLNKGKINRREFVQYAALVGVSAGVAMQMAGLPGPKKVFAQSIKRGGILRVSSPVHKMTHPAQISSIGPSNMLRQVLEYMTYTDKQGVTHPYLLKNWKVSEDLKTWTLNLRQGVNFNNGDEFVADDVVFTINQWLSKDIGSSLRGMIGSYLSSSGIEKTSRYQVVLHLDRPEIGVPEHLFLYPAFVLNHKTFDGDFLREPHGTGPYTMETYREGEICAVKRRQDYWQKGADGSPLPYMDGMEFIDMGTEMAPQISAIRSGEVDFLELGDATGLDAYNALKNASGVKIKSIGTAQTRVLRMRTDVDPFKDNRVRTALKLCQNREKILALAYFSEGLLGHDTHVSPIHPEYCEKPIPEYQPEKAKQLLKEAGYPNGLEVTLSATSEWSDVVRYAEILKEDAIPAGFRIKIQTMPISQFWDRWLQVPLGITDWQARPLGTMVLNLAYTIGPEGEPVTWNETRWVDDEFNKLLEKANGTLDIQKRKEIFCELEQIQMDRGSIGIAYWRNTWSITSNRVQGAEPNPSNYMLFNQVWLDQKA